MPFHGQGLGDLDGWVGPWVVHQLATSAGEEEEVEEVEEEEEEVRTIFR